MDNLNNLISKEEQDFFHTYKRLSMIIERGEGCYLYNDKGEKILDMFGGLAVNVLGYNHPRINEAIEAQIKNIFMFPTFYQEKQIALAEIILKLTGFSKVFFSNSGTESTEAAIKLIRKIFHRDRQEGTCFFQRFISRQNYGGTISYFKKKYREQYAPCLKCSSFGIQFD
jgi:acetylornithine/succinyldiaminopimelate/putrescine aminotransferase